MARDELDGPRRPPTTEVLRVGFGLLALIALVAGSLGMRQYLQARDAPTPGLDLLYYALQLFVLGADPLQQGGPYPWLLNVARFCAPVVTIYAFVEAGRVLATVQARRLRTRRARGHVVVCGDGLIADTLARHLRSAGRRVVLVRAEPAGDPGLDGPLTVIGDARRAAVLRAAGLTRARTLYACTGQSATNTAIALTAGRLASTVEGGPAVYAEITDPDLCLALQARHLGLPHAAESRVDFFNVDELAARRLFTDLPLPAAAEPPPRILVVGGSAFGRAVLVELGRRWRVTTGGGEPLPVTVVDANANRTVEELSGRYPFLADACQFAPHRGELLDLLAAGAVRPPYTRVFICHDDEERALKEALTAEPLWHAGPRSVVVQLNRLAPLRDAFVSSGDHLLDVASGALYLHAVVEAGCDPDLIGEDLVERLARVIHDRYLARHAGAASPAPALVPWEDLAEHLRLANREQARDIGRKLHEVGRVLVVRSPAAGPDAPLTDEELEHLAEMEHERWVAERRAAGWRLDADRDDARRLHSAMLPWAELPEDVRDLDRHAVRQMPGILADAGFQIVRVPRQNGERGSRSRLGDRPDRRPGDGGAHRGGAAWHASE